MAKNATEHQVKEESWEKKGEDWKLSEREQNTAGSRFMENLESHDRGLAQGLKDSLEKREGLSHTWRGNELEDYRSTHKGHTDTFNSFRAATEGMNEGEKEYLSGELARAIVGDKIREKAEAYGRREPDTEDTLTDRLDRAEKNLSEAITNPDRVQGEDQYHSGIIDLEQARKETLEMEQAGLKYSEPAGRDDARATEGNLDHKTEDTERQDAMVNGYQNWVEEKYQFTQRTGEGQPHHGAAQPGLGYASEYPQPAEDARPVSMMELAFDRERWKDLQEYVSEMNIPEQDARAMTEVMLTRAGLQTGQREMDALTDRMLGVVPPSENEDDFPDYRDYEDYVPDYRDYEDGEERKKSFFEKVMQTIREWLGYEADPGSGGEFLTDEEYQKVREQELRTEELLLQLGYGADQ